MINYDPAWKDGKPPQAPEYIPFDVNYAILKGMIFRHTKWLDDSYKRPLVCKITKVAQGLVYYRPVDGGAPMFFPIEERARWIKDFING